MTWQPKLASHTWFAVVSTTSLFNSLSTASHCQIYHNFKANKNPRKTKELYFQDHWMMKIKDQTGVDKITEHTTHPEPCTPAPSVLILAINFSIEPKCWSIAHPKEPCGGSPPPSCKNIHSFKSSSMLRNQNHNLSELSLRKKAYTSRSKILPKDWVIHMTWSENIIYL